MAKKNTNFTINCELTVFPIIIWETHAEIIMFLHLIIPYRNIY